MHWSGIFPLFSDTWCMCMCIYEGIYYGNWLVWLWGLKRTTSCPLPAADPGEPVGWLSLRLEAWEWGGVDGGTLVNLPENPGVGWELLVECLGVQRPENQVSMSKAGEVHVLVQEETGFALPLPFCSIWACNGLDDACVCCWDWIFLLSVLTQMLTSETIVHQLSQHP